MMDSFVATPNALPLIDLTMFFYFIIITILNGAPCALIANTR